LFEYFWNNVAQTSCASFLGSCTGCGWSLLLFYLMLFYLGGRSPATAAVWVRKRAVDISR
jgi:uncharacterized membrane protein YfcA